MKALSEQQLQELVRVAYQSANDVVCAMRARGERKIQQPRGVLRLTVVQRASREDVLLRELVSFSIGELPDEKRDRYHALSLEKTTRLAGCIFDGSCYYSSFQSRNPDEDQWGGAVMTFLCEMVPSLAAPFTLTGCCVLSFSGLKEDSDEALVLLIARRLPWIYSMFSDDICAASNNGLARDLLRELSHEGSLSR